MTTQRRERLGLGAALAIFFVLLFFSLFKNAVIQGATFHIGFDLKRLGMIWIPLALTAAISAAFVVAEFSFGYMVGFYLFTMMAGYSGSTSSVCSPTITTGRCFVLSCRLHVSYCRR